MRKKEYIQPTLEAVQLNYTAIICGSVRGLGIIDEEVSVYEEDPDVPEELWGSQW